MTQAATGTIRVLPETVSSRIAAGEVVERPAAVVKELIDNSLDAESSLITIEVEEGGRRLIRVTDNGVGMSRGDAPLACQRFATSKLRHEEDLTSITTLGFRGEALPSIASVSRLWLRTIQNSDLLGVELHSEGGVGWTVSDYSGPQGTQVEIQDLFFNTPARRQFLKSVSTEFSRICQIIQQAAMAWPTIHFRLFHNGHAVWDFPAETSRANRLLQIYGDRVMSRMLPIDHEQAGIRVEGVTISPYYARPTRTHQEIFVNRRSIKNTTIAHATYEAYGSFLPKGKHPAFALFLDLDPSVVDVNVHPAKREVRFTDQDRVHSAVKEAVRQPLCTAPSRFGGIPSFEASTKPLDSPFLHHGATQSVEDDRSGSAESFVKTPSLHYRVEPESGSAQPSIGFRSEETPSMAGTDIEIRPFGQIRHTFLVAQIGQDLHVIDQHTAHERVLYERLKRAWDRQSLQLQPLLIPEPVELAPYQCHLLSEHMADLARLGLEIDRFGAQSFLVRAVPTLLGKVDVTALVHHVLEDLSEWKSPGAWEEKVRSILASMACRSAVQAGRSMALQEINTLLTDWVHEECPLTCPHGRRIAFRMSMDELNAMFGRS